VQILELRSMSLELRSMPLHASMNALHGSAHMALLSMAGIGPKKDSTASRLARVGRCNQGRVSCLH